MSRDSSDDVIESRPGGDTGSGTPYRGVRSLAAILPNGRIVWLRVDESLAPVRALGNLGQLADNTARWRHASVQSQREAIERLSRTIASDTERTLDARVARTGATRRRIVASHRRLDRKLAKAREEHRTRVEKQLRIERESVARLGRRDLWDKLLVLSSLPLFAAYGQSGAPLNANNVALLLTLLVFLVGDQIVDALFGSGDKSPYPVRDADAWTYLAPAANLLAGWWLLSDRQNERFVAGRTVFPVERFERAVHPILPPRAPVSIRRRDRSPEGRWARPPGRLQDIHRRPGGGHDQLRRALRHGQCQRGTGGRAHREGHRRHADHHGHGCCGSDGPRAVSTWTRSK